MKTNYFDPHELMIKDVQIMQLERELKETLRKLNHTVNCLEYYRAQHNGHLANQTLSLVHDLSYEEDCHGY